MNTQEKALEIKERAQNIGVPITWLCQDASRSYQMFCKWCQGSTASYDSIMVVEAALREYEKLTPKDLAWVKEKRRNKQKKQGER